MENTTTTQSAASQAALPFRVGDVVRLQYGTRKLPFLAVVNSIEHRADFDYVGWTRQVDDSAIGGWNMHAGQFGAFRFREHNESHVRVLHP